jgi:hypothetical protein
MKQAATMAAGIESAACVGDGLGIPEALAAFDSEMAALSAAVDAYIAGK